MAQHCTRLGSEGVPPASRLRGQDALAPRNSVNTYRFDEYWQKYQISIYLPPQLVYSHITPRAVLVRGGRPWL